MKQIKSMIAVMALTLTAALVSCSSEAVKEVANGIGGGGKSNVVTFQFGNGNKSTTRAEAEDYSTGVPVGLNALAGFDRENAINFDKLYVVVFKLNADGQTYSWYKTFKKDGTDGTALTKTAGATAADDKFQFDMGDGGVYYMYVIANTEVDLTTQTITDRESLYQIIDQLDKTAYVSGGTNKLNEVTDLLMTSNQIQVNIKGDEETVLDPITLTRAIARIDINASAMPDNFRIDKVKFKNRYNKTYLIRGTKGEAMTDASLTKDNSSSPKEYAKDDVKIDVTPATPGPPGPPAVSNYEGTFDNVWNGVIYACENYDVTDGGRTKLIVEGTYTSGDRNGITVSHEIDFGTMKIQRNYLYQVRMALEDPAPDTYGKVIHAISVKDWTSGVTLAWAGDENLYNSTAAANFTVTGTERKLREASVSELEQHLVLPYNAEKSATFYVTSTSTKSGLSLTCPAMSVNATAEELALNTSADNYQCKIQPLPEECVYNEDGTFIQKWKVTVRESAFANGNILTFTLQNALNSALSASFEVSGAPFASFDDIQAGDIYYANGYWSRPADMEECITRAVTTATGVVAPVAAKESEDNALTAEYCVKSYSNIDLGDIYYSAGFWSPGTSAAVTACKAVSTPIALVYSTTPTTSDSGRGFHAYAMALKDASASCQWSTTATSIGVFSATSYSSTDQSATIASFNTDRDGYTKMLAVMEIDDWATKYPAFAAAKNYSASIPVGGCSGWYLPTVGQMKDFFLWTGGYTDTDWYAVNTNGLWMNGASQYNMTHNFAAKLITAGLAVNNDYTLFFEDKTTPTADQGYWLASEYNASYSYSIAVKSGDQHLHLSPNGLSSMSAWNRVKTTSWPVRSVLAF